MSTRRHLLALNMVKRLDLRKPTTSLTLVQPNRSFEFSYVRIAPLKLQNPDFPEDCPDNSDEDPSFCATYDCGSVGALTCPGSAKQCIRRLSSNNTQYREANPYGPSSTPPGYPTSFCDGVNDCNVSFPLPLRPSAAFMLGERTSLEPAAASSLIHHR
jgi:hypothetical protein